MHLPLPHGLMRFGAAWYGGALPASAESLWPELLVLHTLADPTKRLCLKVHAALGQSDLLLDAVVSSQPISVSAPKPTLSVGNHGLPK